MHALRRWNPWRELAGLRNEMDRMICGEPARTLATSRDWPQFNVWTNEDEAIVTSELPGINLEKLDINVSNDVITIAGSLNRSEETEIEKYQRRERASCEFERSLQLPFSVDTERAKANYRNGVLEIRLHRPESEKPRSVTVKAG